MNHDAREINWPAERWLRSSICKPTGNCVEVNLEMAGSVGIRDSKAEPTAHLTVGRAQWSAFVAHCRSSA